MSASSCHIRTRGRAHRPRPKRKDRYCWQRVRHRKTRFNAVAGFLKPRVSHLGFQRGSRVQAKPEADKLQEKVVGKCLSSFSSRRFNRGGERGWEEAGSHLHRKSCNTARPVMRIKPWVSWRAMGPSESPRKKSFSPPIRLSTLSESFSDSRGPQRDGGKCFWCQKNRAAHSYTTFSKMVSPVLPLLTTLCELIGSSADWRLKANTAQNRRLIFLPSCRVII